MRSAVWTKKKTVDSNDILGPLAVLSKERELQIDTGSITAEIVNDVVTSVQLDLKDGNNEVAVLEPPVKIPFSQAVDQDRKAMAGK